MYGTRRSNPAISRMSMNLNEKDKEDACSTCHYTILVVSIHSRPCTTVYYSIFSVNQLYTYCTPVPMMQDSLPALGTDFSKKTIEVCPSSKESLQTKYVPFWLGGGKSGLVHNTQPKVSKRFFRVLAPLRQPCNSHRTSLLKGSTMS